MTAIGQLGNAVSKIGEKLYEMDSAIKTGIITANSLYVTGNTTISGDLTVSGEIHGVVVTLGTDITATTLLVTSLTTLNSVYVTGNVTIGTNATVGGALQVTGTTTLIDATTIGGALQVTGASILKGAVAVTGATTMYGAATVGGALQVTGTSTVLGGIVYPVETSEIGGANKELTTADSGKTFRCKQDNGTDYYITVPSTITGESYKFVLTTSDANTLYVYVKGGEKELSGIYVDGNATPVHMITGKKEINFVGGKIATGATIILTGASGKYSVLGLTNVDGGIGIS